MVPWWIRISPLPEAMPCCVQVTGHECSQAGDEVMKSCVYVFKYTYTSKDNMNEYTNIIYPYFWSFFSLNVFGTYNSTFFSQHKACLQFFWFSSSFMISETHGCLRQDAASQPHELQRSSTLLGVTSVAEINFKGTRSYCWWKKSCTCWSVVSPIIYKVLYILGGAGFLPSTVVIPYLEPETSM